MDLNLQHSQILARDLLQRLVVMQGQIAETAGQMVAGWGGRIQREDFAESALNMAVWLALRRHDLTPLQAPLTALGLSTLGRLDGHVSASLQAVLAALSRIAGDVPRAFPHEAAFRQGAAVLAARRDAMFGEQGAGDPRTRVMATLPTEAGTDGGKLIQRLVAAGLDCFRINCAHDSPDIWAAMIGHVRAAETEAGRRLPVSMDLGGPKFRVTGVVDRKLPKADKRVFLAGDRFALVGDLGHAPPDMFGAVLSHAALMEALAPGSVVSIDDGKLWARVVARHHHHVELEVTRTPAKGGRIKLEKGVNLPGSELRVDALTDADLTALDFVVGHADIVSYSFVQTVGDVRALIAAMRARAVPGAALPAVVLKIETPLALRNLPELIVEAGGTLPVGVMIARGDLAVEINFDRLSEIQEEILWLCEAAQVPVIWATQVLEGMVKDGQASRAEVTDAAMSQRAECVMLNKGPHVVEAVTFLRGILHRMDRHMVKKSPRLGPLKVWAGGV